MPRLTFLHTAQSNARLFGALVLDLAPQLAGLEEPVHLVGEAFLTRAVAEGGISENLRSDLAGTVEDAFSAGADLVVCTCSTLGQAAEEAGRRLGKPVMRIDRPMAEEAVRIGGHVVVAACLATTIDPTTDLLKEVAVEQGRQVDLSMLLIPDAWPLFERNEKEAYERMIAEEVRAVAGDCSAVVLAQASMAGAAHFCQDLALPVLSSPVMGVQYALERLKH